MLPEVFLERMQRMLGEEYDAFLGSFGQERHQALRLNPLKIGLDGRSAAERYGFGTGGEMPGFAHLTKVPWAEDGYYYEPADQPGKHPFHEAGLYYIQEPSAMAPVELLEVCPGDRVLDLCAAPGGKSVQIAAKLRGRGFLLSNEIHPARAKILSENVERMGIRNACVTNESPERLAALFPEYFDSILVDAPCSGEGMFRKNEAACGEWSPENVRLCAERQDGILDCAAQMLGPGGRLVYSTCTFAPEEDEGSVSRFLERHGEFRILPIEKSAMGLAGCDGVPDCVDNPAPGLEHTLRLWPHRVRGEGHFAAVLQKMGGMPYRANRCEERTTDQVPGRPAHRTEAGKYTSADIAANRAAAAGVSAANDMLDGVADVRGAGVDDVSQHIRFGDNLYLAPAGMPSLKGLRVLRPGLHLGELKKDRFDPSHALALALPPQYAAHRWYLSSADPLVGAYLNGQTFPAEGEKGWYLICVDGFGIGWGKLAGGIMKNHYPKGLRR